jgi:uncharacterized protein YukE
MVQNVFISSEEIKSFQGKLQQLADDLIELHDALERQLATLHEDWDDPKYQEFVDEFDREKQHIVEISDKFHDMVTGDLQDRYDKALVIEGVH